MHIDEYGFILIFFRWFCIDLQSLLQFSLSPFDMLMLICMFSFSFIDHMGPMDPRPAQAQGRAGRSAGRAIQAGRPGGAGCRSARIRWPKAYLGGQLQNMSTTLHQPNVLHVCVRCCMWSYFVQRVLQPGTSLSGLIVLQFLHTPCSCTLLVRVQLW